MFPFWKKHKEKIKEIVDNLPTRKKKNLLKIYFHIVFAHFCLGKSCQGNDTWYFTMELTWHFNRSQSIWFIKGWKRSFSSPSLDLVLSFSLSVLPILSFFILCLAKTTTTTIKKTHLFSDNYIVSKIVLGDT